MKHRTVLMMMYAAGLPLSEALRLQLADVDSGRQCLRVEQGKGQQDRHTLLPPTVLQQLRDYWRLTRPGRWLFPGQRPDAPLTPTAIQRQCGAAARGAKLAKRVTTHTMRHCFATHLLEAPRPGRTAVSADSPERPRPRRRPPGATALRYHTVAAPARPPASRHPRAAADPNPIPTARSAQRLSSTSCIRSAHTPARERASSPASTCRGHLVSTPDTILYVRLNHSHHSKILLVRAWLASLMLVAWLPESRDVGRAVPPGGSDRPARLADRQAPIGLPSVRRVIRSREEAQVLAQGSSADALRH